MNPGELHTTFEKWYVRDGIVIDGERYAWPEPQHRVAMLHDEPAFVVAVVPNLTSPILELETMIYVLLPDTMGWTYEKALLGE